MLNHDDSNRGSHSRLRARFSSALRSSGATADGTPVFELLVARYGETHRHYHTLEHIDACLGWLDWLTARAEHPEEVELALWFHDVVYDPQRSDNERCSADLARQLLRELGVPDPTIDRIAHHIVATAHHGATTGDTALLIDIDLTILGAAPADVERFEQQIRREYAHVEEPAYRNGRARVLQGFLSREHIFTTPAVVALLESRARTNLERAISALSESAP